MFTARTVNMVCTVWVLVGAFVIMSAVWFQTHMNSNHLGFMFVFVMALGTMLMLFFMLVIVFTIRAVRMGRSLSFMSNRLMTVFVIASGIMSVLMLTVRSVLVLSHVLPHRLAHR
jgi:hypothetical protein